MHLILTTIVLFPLQERYIAQCENETKRRTESSSYELALRVIDNTLAKAREYEARMTSMESASLSPEQLACDVPPALFKGQLRDYQMAGFQWLVKRCFLGESVILADAMGLGKTIQILAYLAWTKEHVDGSTLIICPLSTLGNWLLETKRFLPDVPVIRYYGTADEKRDLDKKIRKYVSAAQKYNRTKAQWTEYSENPVGPAPPSLPAVAYFPIVLASYEVAVKDAPYLLRVQWKDMILDEAHRLKNEKGITRRILTQYSQARSNNEPLQKIMLTGTPIQNDLIELWSLCHFLLPAVFSSSNEFKRVYSFVGQGTKHHTTTLLQQEQENHVISKLQELVQRYVLRRTKREVKISLPPKVEFLIYCPLTAVQVQLLRAVHAKTLPETLTKMRWGHPGDDSGIIRAAGLSMASLSNRKICVHPYFLAEPLSNRGKTDDQIITTCGKMIVFDALLQKLRKKGHRVLIFSQFSTVIDILSDYLTYRENLFGEYRVITGSTPVNERDEAIAEFHTAYRGGKPASAFSGQESNDIFAFLLSTRAGGLGINLVGADTVIFYDSDWNPSMDDQAMDRVHRIGQTKPVVVYRLVTEGAGIEKRMLHVAQTKQGLGKMSLRDEFTLFRPTTQALAPSLLNDAPHAGESKHTGAKDHAASSLDANLFHYWVNPDSILEGAASPSTETVTKGDSSALATEVHAPSSKPAASAPSFRGIDEDELEQVSNRNQAVFSGLTHMAHIEHLLLQSEAEASKAKDDSVSTPRSEDLLNQLQTEVKKNYQSWIPPDTPYVPYRGNGYMVVYHSTTGKEGDGESDAVSGEMPSDEATVIDDTVPDELLLAADLDVHIGVDADTIATTIATTRSNKKKASQAPSKLTVPGSKRTASSSEESEALYTPVGRDGSNTPTPFSSVSVSSSQGATPETLSPRGSDAHAHAEASVEPGAGAGNASGSASTPRTAAGGKRGRGEAVSGAEGAKKEPVAAVATTKRGAAKVGTVESGKQGGGSLITTFFKRQTGAALEKDDDVDEIQPSKKKATATAASTRRKSTRG